MSSCNLLSIINTRTPEKVVLPWVNFINVKRSRFCMNVISAAFFCICTNVKKAAETTFVQKTHAFNVDEIDTILEFPF